MAAARGARPGCKPRGDVVTEDREPIHLTTPRSPESTGTPRVRTLLVCDLADSTALVERLGDTGAAELMRRHDRVARDLLARHGGREIDKTDGFLVLFERPVEAVAFALAYQRALHQLGEASHQTLRARVGIHVGEVVVWENTQADIAGGAKRVDVEGLAKPVVSRLMSLALPGQIVLSGIAFSLAQRAERELDPGAGLRWLTHGRYRFKGVAAPMLVHEVGEPGFAPLQAPPNNAKAQREVPVWRKPGVLALEALALLAAIAVPVALSLRAPPAIAFGERDWLVVGDLRNLTGDPELDASLETAFRISIEQSRFINVLPDLKLQNALARMQRPADTTIDREVASEIALREGARAVILPTVAEIGGRVRVSAEVIDPHTQTTVYAESADGVGTDSALDSIDAVTQDLRARLGEAMASIENDSTPLPQITSGKLDALRAYALATEAQSQSRNQDAALLYEQALELDPDFALAHLGLTRLKMVVSDRAGAIVHARRAAALRDRLTARDALYADAWLASFGSASDMIEKWKLLADLYPDYFAGWVNYAYSTAQYANRYDEAIAAMQRATVQQNPLRAGVQYALGALLASQERFDEAMIQFTQAGQLGHRASGELLAATWAAQRQLARADEALAGVSVPAASAEGLLRRVTAISLGLERGDPAQAARLADEAIADGRDNASVWTRVFELAGLVARVHAVAEPDLAPLRAYIDAHGSDALDTANANRPRALYGVLFAAYLGARHGDVALAREALQRFGPAARDSGYPNVAAMADVLQVEMLRASGQPDEAVALVQSRLDADALYQMHSAAQRAFAAAGRHADALREAEWLARRRGLAWLEWGDYRIQTPLNALDANIALLAQAEAQLAQQRHAEAAAALDALLHVWPQPPLALAARIESLRAELHRSSK